MQISLDDAGAQLTELLRRAEAGEEMLLTFDGKPIAQLVPVAPVPTAAERRAILEKIVASAAKSATPGPSAARSQDFLYDEDGLPR